MYFQNVVDTWKLFTFSENVSPPGKNAALWYCTYIEAGIPIFQATSFPYIFVSRCIITTTKMLFILAVLRKAPTRWRGCWVGRRVTDWSEMKCTSPVNLCFRFLPKSFPPNPDVISTLSLLSRPSQTAQNPFICGNLLVAIRLPDPVFLCCSVSYKGFLSKDKITG